MESDFRYYSRRASEERRLATRAITPEARERHRELASLFDDKATEFHGSARQLASGDRRTRPDPPLATII